MGKSASERFKTELWNALREGLYSAGSLTVHFEDADWDKEFRFRFYNEEGNKKLELRHGGFLFSTDIYNTLTAQADPASLNACIHLYFYYDPHDDDDNWSTTDYLDFVRWFVVCFNRRTATLASQEKQNIDIELSDASFSPHSRVNYNWLYLYRGQSMYSALGFLTEGEARRSTLEHHKDHLTRLNMFRNRRLDSFEEFADVRTRMLDANEHGKINTPLASDTVMKVAGWLLDGKIWMRNTTWIMVSTFIMKEFIRTCVEQVDVRSFQEGSIARHNKFSISKDTITYAMAIGPITDVTFQLDAFSVEEYE